MKYNLPGQNLEYCNRTRRTSYPSRNLELVTGSARYILGSSRGSHTFRGTLEKKKEYLPVALQWEDRVSGSNISPIGNPHPDRNHSCRLVSGSAWIPCIGARSKLGASPATAAGWMAQNHSRTSLVASTPMKSGEGLWAKARRPASSNLLYASVNPLRIMTMSPCLSSSDFSWTMACRSFRGMAVDSNA